MTEPIEGQAELTEQDFRQAFPFVPQFRRSSRIWLIAPLLLIVAFSNQKLDRTFWLPALPLLAVVPLSMGLRWLIRRTWSKRALSDLGSGTTSFRFDAAGLSVKSSLRQHQLTWASLPEHIETPTSFLVYTSSQTLLVIPKRAFVPDLLEALQADLRRRIPTKPRKKLMQSLLLVWVLLIVAFLAIWHFLTAS